MYHCVALCIHISRQFDKAALWVNIAEYTGHSVTHHRIRAATEQRPLSFTIRLNQDNFELTFTQTPVSRSPMSYSARAHKADFQTVPGSCGSPAESDAKRGNTGGRCV